jgi:hypothetical protein
VTAGEAGLGPLGAGGSAADARHVELGGGGRATTSDGSDGRSNFGDILLSGVIWMPSDVVSIKLERGCGRSK